MFYDNKIYIQNFIKTNFKYFNIYNNNKKTYFNLSNIKRSRSYVALHHSAYFNSLFNLTITTNDEVCQFVSGAFEIVSSG